MRIYQGLFAFLLTIAISGNVFAQSEGALYAAYDDGYDDGYDDAMDDCPCPPWSYLFGGFYAGVGVGYDAYQVERRPFILDDPIGKFNTHANGWNGKLFGGYGQYWDRYYLGGEVFVSQSGAYGNDAIMTFGTQYNGQFSVGTSAGVSILPGFKLTENSPLIYGRLGYIGTEFKVNDNSFGMGVTNWNWTSGLNVGFGVEMPIYKNITGRFGYDYMTYGSFKNNCNNNCNISSSNRSISDNRASFDVSYHFLK